MAPQAFNKNSSRTIDNKENKSIRHNRAPKGGNCLVQHSPVKQTYHAHQPAHAQRKPPTLQRKRQVTPTLKPNYLKNVQSRIKQQIQHDKANFYQNEVKVEIYAPEPPRKREQPKPAEK